MRVLLVGHGRMGRLVESLAPSYGCEIVAVVDTRSDPGLLDSSDLDPVDVAIDFTLPDAVPTNVRRLARRGINVVIGTTGWSDHEPALRNVAAEAGIGALASANFSLWMNMFQLVIEEAARRFTAHDSYGAWIHERHHSAKKDAPSGTALQLEAGMRRVGYGRPIDVASTRAGSIPGTHTVGFNGPSDAVILTHEVRDRAVFARGALEAARWLRGRRGWYTLRDMLEASL